jgi:hypothetical protein
LKAERSGIGREGRADHLGFGAGAINLESGGGFGDGHFFLDLDFGFFGFIEDCTSFVISRIDFGITAGSLNDLIFSSAEYKSLRSSRFLLKSLSLYASNSSNFFLEIHIKLIEVPIVHFQPNRIQYPKRRGVAVIECLDTKIVDLATVMPHVRLLGGASRGKKGNENQNFHNVISG